MFLLSKLSEEKKVSGFTLIACERATQFKFDFGDICFSDWLIF